EALLRLPAATRTYPGSRVHDHTRVEADERILVSHAADDPQPVTNDGKLEEPVAPDDLLRARIRVLDVRGFPKADDSGGEIARSEKYLGGKRGIERGAIWEIVELSQAEVSRA